MGPEWAAILSLSMLKGLHCVFGYISNNAFPHPLSEEEETKTLEKFENGDEEARNLLIEHNLRLVAHITKKFESAGLDKDDLISIGTIGLIKAINTFNRGKGTKLATYAARCIENEILMHLRSTKNMRTEVSLYDPIGTDKEGNEVSLVDVLGTEGDLVLQSIESYYEQKELLEKVETLENRERFVLQSRYGLFNSLRRTQREIAKKLGISRSYVSRIEKKAIQKLTQELSKSGNSS
ncbi:RNA polymerase sporulation sigma factor SigK [Dehalobacterium formicoaceticum]|uniref:RNA polymerase sigma factor n=1 Tax=Dehalobacterium formicoaceticum TaxID=51515 RepID=A0ABT1Y881_9FIRM|nr:RNA polymerase sporulation sigma factor SigK [Dehalobacterium formicoaceticum]MCR6546773.1 RNA polymerase sporulation sigma factor SigK [Dehalobacterium formicoaceticum]